MIQLLAIDVRGKRFRKHRRVIDLHAAGMIGRAAGDPTKRQQSFTDHKAWKN